MIVTRKRKKEKIPKIVAYRWLHALHYLGMLGGVARLPINTTGIYSAHVYSKSPLNISTNPSEVIPKEPYDNF